MAKLISARGRRFGAGLLVSAGLALALVAAGVSVPALSQKAVAADATGCSVYASSFATQSLDGGGANVRVGCARDSGSYRSLAGSDNDVVAAVESDVALIIAVLRLANQVEGKRGRVDTVVAAVEVLTPQTVQALVDAGARAAGSPTWNSRWPPQPG